MKRADSIEFLIRGYFAGDLDDRDLETLQRALSEDPEVRAAFVLYAHDEAHLAESLSGRKAAMKIFPLVVSHRRRPVLRSLSWAAAVAIMMLGGWLGVSRFIPITGNDKGPIAEMTLQVDANWAGTKRFSDGQTLAPQVLDLRSGLARILFNSGAEVTLEGPARFELVSADLARLHAGVLTAEVPKEAIGFEIKTEAVDVIDLGTAFGVSVGDDGATDVMVFEGKVRVNSGAEDKRTARLLLEGDAVRANRDGTSVEEVEFQPRPFETALPVAAGVLETTGDFRFVSPGDWKLRELEDDRAVMVLQERKRVVLKKPLEVDVVASGGHRADGREGGGSLPQGTRVRSYLLLFNPVGSPPKSDAASWKGTLRFERPIIGLLTTSSSLDASDGLFGSKRATYDDLGKSRGLEVSSDSGVGDVQIKDGFKLSRDRRELTLGFRATSSYDQIRVLVELPQPTPKSKGAKGSAKSTPASKGAEGPETEQAERASKKNGSPL